MSSVRPPLTRYLSSLSRTDLRATTETSWSAPREYDVEKAAGVKSAALRPTEEDGRSGWAAVSATESANGTFFANSCWISFSSSGKVKTDLAVGRVPLVVGVDVRGGLRRSTSRG